MKRERSLFQRLIFGFTGVMLLVWLAMVGLYLAAAHNYSLKHETRGLNMIADWVLAQALPGLEHPDALRASAARIERLQNAYNKDMGMEQDFHVQIWLRGRAIYRSSGLPEALPDLAHSAPDATLGTGGEWLSWVSQDIADGLTVRVVHHVIGGPRVTPDNPGYYILPLIFSMPFLLFPAWFVIRVGLRPLEHVVAQLKTRSGTALAPLEPSSYKELSPVVASVNELMHRLAERLRRERSFLADAAHELKTPLAVIQINADTIVDDQDRQRVRAAYGGLSAGVARATHTVHQLLALARSGAEVQHDDLLPLDLSCLLRDRMVLAVHLAMQRQVELELRAPESCILMLNRESMALMIDNLIDNAIKYSPDGARVLVTLRTSPCGMQLLVCDQGPGIAPELRVRVFERFYRLPGQSQAGSGLGLAIAETAAQRNHATIQLNAGDDGVGTIATVTLSPTST